MVARELSVSCKEEPLEQAGSRADKVLDPAGQSLWWLIPREVSMAWSSTLVCGARLSQQWSEPASVIPLRLMYSTLLGLLINVLTPLLASMELPQKPVCGWSCSADMAVLITCADILGVSSCQII